MLLNHFYTPNTVFVSRIPADENSVWSVKMIQKHCFEMCIRDRYFGFKQRGAVAPGYRADLVVVSDLESFTVEQVYKLSLIHIWCMFGCL